MKKNLFFLLFSVLTFAQTPPKNNTKSFDGRKHEVKLGAVKLLSGSIVEFTYEHIISDDFTVGSSLLVNCDTSNDYWEDFSITPFARFYFQESKPYGAQGFFVEGFGKYASGRNINDSFNPKYSAASMGISLGKKWINRSGFVFEALVGVSRKLGGSDVAPDAFFRGDLCIGYRF